MTPGISKGKFISRWLSKLPYFDSLLDIGDSETDEDIFALIDKPHYSIRVGKSIRSSARFYVEEQMMCLRYCKDCHKLVIIKT